MGEKVLMKGNEAIGEAAICSGCRHFFGYPITPQTELSAYMAKKMPKINGVFLQAESEVSAINMVYGAAAAGMRTMTSSQLLQRSSLKITFFKKINSFVGFSLYFPWS